MQKKFQGLAVKNTHVLLGDIKSLIEKARGHVAHAVDAGLVLLYWNIGKRIREDILLEKRAAYGQQIVSTLSTKLVPVYGQGFGWRNLARMVRFSEKYPNPNIVQTLSAQLGWSHFLELLPNDGVKSLLATFSFVKGEACSDLTPFFTLLS